MPDEPPSVAELIRKDATVAVPRTRQVEVVSFDDLAADSLGRLLPISVLKELRDHITNVTLTHLKYDALIATCAVRHKADCIVAIDPHFGQLAQHLGIDVRRPSDFLVAQQSLAGL